MEGCWRQPERMAQCACGIWRQVWQLWGVADGKEKHKFEVFPGLVLALAFSPDGNQIVATVDSLVEKVIKVWDLRSGQEVAILRDHSASIWGLAFSRDGRLMASASA